MRFAFFLLSFLFFHFLSFAQAKPEIQHAWRLIEQNAAHSAIIEMDMLDQVNLTKSEKIQCLDIKKWAFFFNQEFTAFHQTSREQHALINPLPDSPEEATYLAEQAFFFHYLAWQDSVLHYLMPCKKILENTPLNLAPMQKAFVYAMMANGQLYINYHDEPFHLIKYKRIDSFFSQAIAALSSPTALHLRLRSVIMRSWASRTLDRVTGYRYLTSAEVKARPQIIQSLDALTHQRYLEAANCTPKNCVEDQVAALELCGLMHSYLAHYEQAHTLFESAIQRIENYYGSLAHCPQPKVICLLLKYKLANDEKRLGTMEHAEDYIKKLSQLQPIYNGLTRFSKQFRHDTYHSSPTHILACILLQKAKKENNDSLYQLGAAHFIENQELEFLSIPNSQLALQLRQYLADIEKNPKKESSLPAVFRSLAVNPSVIEGIQKKLSDTEIILCCNQPTALMNNCVLVIAHNKIDWINTQEFKEHAHYKIGASYDPQLFKKFHFALYQTKFEPILKKFPNTSRFYVMYNDPTLYEQLIDSSNGSGFHEMDFIFKKYQFNRIYQVKKYFTTPAKNLEKKVNLFSLTQPQFKPLLFTLDILAGLFYSSFEIQEEPDLTLMESVQKPIITHLYGHGTADSSKLGYFKYAIPYLENTKWNDLHNLQSAIPQSQSLVIFNTCFSGATNYMLNYDTNLYPSLLHNGAPAVIISTSHSEDQASSEIFASFYRNMEMGIPAEDAFYLAKKNYLEKQKGENCNPLRWNAYRLISSQKIEPFTPRSWWEILWQYFTNLQYLFAPPVVG
jgi:hypothetical protein